MRVWAAAIVIALTLSQARPALGQAAPLRFVGDRDYPPLSYVEDGQPRGFDVDVLRAIAGVLGRDVRIELMEWADAQSAVMRGEANGLTDLAISEARRTLYDFAESTVTHDFGFFVRASEPGTATLGGVVGKAVGVTQGGFPREFLERRPDVRLVIIPNYDVGFDQLMAGSLDAVAADVWAGASTVERRGLTGVALGGEPFASLPAAIAVRKGDADLLAEINRAIRVLKADGRLQAIQDRWRPKEMVFFSRERMRGLTLGGLGLLVAGLLIATTLWALTLRRQVRVRRATEAQRIETSRRLGLALAAANMGTWRWSAATNLDTRDGNLNRILGLDPVESTQVLDDFFSRVHPDDRSATRSEFDRAIRERDAYMKEFRVVWPDGSTRRLRGRGKAFYDDAGKLEYATGVAVDITPETESAERSALLAHALESANDCIFIVDPSRHILYVNEAFLKTFEYRPDEILGRHLNVIHPVGEAPSLSPAEADGWRSEVLNQSKTGHVFTSSLATSVVRDARGAVAAMVGVLRDITNEKLAEDALRASEEKFFKAFEASPDAIAILDLDGRGLMMVNEAFERITGYGRHEVLGRTMREIGMFVEPGRRDEILERVRAQNVSRDVEFQIRRKNGQVATILLSGATIEIGGRLCFLTVSRDITERKLFELHLRQTAELNKLLLTEMDLEGLSVAVIESVHKILALDYAGLTLIDPDTRTPRLAAQRGVLDAGRSASAGLALASLLSRRDGIQVLRGDGLTALGDAVAPLVTAGIRVICSLPLATAQGTLGMLTVGSTATTAFSERDVTLLHQLSTYVAIAIQNARSYAEIRALKDRVSMEKLYLQEEIRVDRNFADVIGGSAAIKRVLQQIETVAPTDASVLILGETGTGKELLARALHELSARSARTFVRVNVAALPATLLESELFGHERGAFTGAAGPRVGRIELAHHGTLFLDEIGDIPIEIQPKLLRVLQEREFERLGSNRTLHADVRLIAATNRDLQQMVDEGTFRRDLFYRLNVFPLHVPALRDRKDDIPLLVRYFVQKFCTRLKRHIVSIPSSSLAALQQWHWPGNIRELENVIERAVILSTGDVLQIPPFQLPSASETAPAAPAAVTAVPLSGVTTFAEGEREMILRALREADGVVAGPDGAAARLGIKRTTLQSKMRKLGIRRPSF